MNLPLDLIRHGLGRRRGAVVHGPTVDFSDGTPADRSTDLIAAAFYGWVRAGCPEAPRSRPSPRVPWGEPERAALADLGTKREARRLLRTDPVGRAILAQTEPATFTAPTVSLEARRLLLADPDGRAALAALEGRAAFAAPTTVSPEARRLLASDPVGRAALAAIDGR